MKPLFQDRKGHLNGRGEEFQVLFEHVPAIIAVVDQDYRIVKVNRCFQNAFGDQVGQLCYQAYKGLREKCRKCPVENTFLKGTVQVSEEIGRSKDGQEIYYLVYSAPIHTRQGKIQYALEMSVDLTDRKSLEKKLLANQDFLNNLIENSFCGIVALDSRGKVIVFNRSAEQIFGYKAAEVIGSKNVERFFPRKISQNVLSILENKMGQEILPTSPQETRIRSKSGERISVRFAAVTLSRRGSPMGVVGFFEDLRPLKVMEREKLQAEKLAAVGQTIAGFAHGIKNIVTGLEGGTYIVQSALKKQDDSLIQKGWVMVERNIEKISSLVKDLLSYSKDRIPELQWIHPNELLEEVGTLYRDKASQSKIQLLLDLNPCMGLAYLDPRGIHACLTNLLSNAIDACCEDLGKEHHRIVLRTRRRGDDSIIFEVEDNGIGMTEEVKKRLFTSFFSTKGTRGTGLGLLVTHKIVHELGGRISVETNPGQGSRFCITLPQEEYPTPPDDEATSPQSY
ncbi:MAG: PAS domain S-box protein [Proteobacteria bacterium]|nr:PAS domain S-box protein [Pseudomonadota bacterium]